MAIGDNKLIDAAASASAAVYGVRRAEVAKHNTRRTAVVHARQMAMLFCRADLQMSYPDIGRYFDRDHTTVQHSCNRAEKAMAENTTATGRLARRAYEAMRDAVRRQIDYDTAKDRPVIDRIMSQCEHELFNGKVAHLVCTDGTVIGIRFCMKCRTLLWER